MPAILFCGVVALSSCEKNEQESVNPEFEQGMISQILADSAELSSYSFAGKQLSQVKHYDKESGEVESFEKYERDGNGKLTKVITLAGGNYALLSEQTYTYDSNGKLSKTNMAYYKGGKLEYTAYATFEYNDDKKLEKKSLFEVTTKDGKEEAKQKSYTTYEILPNGNFAKENQYVIDDNGTEALFSTTTYSYDTSLNPFHEFSEPGSVSSPNNLISSTAEVRGSKKSYKYAYSYTYDERGYPLTQTVVTPSGNTESYKYMYSN
jgi:hypothetical protein